MNAECQPKLGKGVKLHRDREGTVMLLVPEGALTLNRVAAVALELVDGKRTLAQIVDAVVERFEVEPARAREDLGGLFDRLSERRFVLREADADG
ncbi:MAG: pyrroloquinoline quinone biosynthesis peptide chaperone PqqD [Candidatus Eremiobacteraeota bacterium]|nr:pyrroloquinoline quinone biosynthesis peptide chaperone PqqD [Candidatus Eremiobacteraeota bacterium]